MAWTPTRRMTHSATMKRLIKDEKLCINKFIEVAKASRTDTHRCRIAKALSGLKKTLAHKTALAWSKLILRNQALSFMFDTYEDFAEACYKQVSSGASKNSVAVALEISNTAVHSAVRYIDQSKKELQSE